MKAEQTRWRADHQRVEITSFEGKVEGGEVNPRVVPPSKKIGKKIKPQWSIPTNGALGGVDRFLFTLEKTSNDE
jgi:hypothetical protein